jgi:predicted amidophosphoribosyltransferase
VPLCLYCDAEHPDGALYCARCNQPVQSESPYPILKETFAMISCPQCARPLIRGTLTCPGCEHDLIDFWKQAAVAPAAADAGKPPELDIFGEGAPAPEQPQAEAAPPADLPPLAPPAEPKAALQPVAPPVETAPLPSTPAPPAAVCASCNAALAPGAQYCEDCGATVAPNCPQCGKANRPGAKFCQSCGQNLRTVPPVSPPPATGLRLVVLRKNGTEHQSFPLREGDNRVGAKSLGEGVTPDVDLSLVEDPDRKVISRRHAVLRVANGRVSVADSGSTNGTTVNGQRLAKDVPVDVDDTSDIVFADISCRLRR